MLLEPSNKVLRKCNIPYAWSGEQYNALKRILTSDPVVKPFANIKHY